MDLSAMYFCEPVPAVHRRPSHRTHASRLLMSNFSDDLPLIVEKNVPRLTPKEIDLLHSIWLELSSDDAPGRNSSPRRSPFRPQRTTAGTRWTGPGTS